MAKAKGYSSGVMPVLNAPESLHYRVDTAFYIRPLTGE